MFRLVVAAFSLVLATSAARADEWSIRSPDGWLRGNPDGAFATEGFSGSASRYTSPEDPASELAVVHLRINSMKSVRETVGGLVDRAIAAGGLGLRVERRSIVDQTDQTIADVSVVGDATVRQIRILAAYNHRDHVVDAVVARCTASPAKNESCGPALASLKLRTVPLAPVEDVGPNYSTLALIAGGLFVLGLVFGQIRHLVRRRSVRKKTPLVDRELVTLTGTVRAINEPLIAPLSGKPCVLHRSRIHLVGGSDAGEGNTVIETSHFVLDTSSGRIHVEQAPEIDVVPSPVVPRDEKRERTFMTQCGIAVGYHSRAGFDEIVVAVGSTIVVHGMIQIDQDPGSSEERGYRDGAPTVTRLVGTPSAPLTIRKLW